MLLLVYVHPRPFRFSLRVHNSTSCSFPPFPDISHFPFVIAFPEFPPFLLFLNCPPFILLRFIYYYHQLLIFTPKFFSPKFLVFLPDSFFIERKYTRIDPHISCTIHYTFVIALIQNSGKNEREIRILSSSFPFWFCSDILIVYYTA